MLKHLQDILVPVVGITVGKGSATALSDVLQAVESLVKHTTPMPKTWQPLPRECSGLIETQPWRLAGLSWVSAAERNRVGARSPLPDVNICLLCCFPPVLSVLCLADIIWWCKNVFRSHRVLNHI